MSGNVTYLFKICVVADVQISLNMNLAKVLPSLGQLFILQLLVYSRDRVLLIQ